MNIAIRAPIGPIPVAAMVLCAACLTGCGSDGAKPVADSTMVDVLVEMHLLNAREQVARRPAAGLRDSVYARYGLDSSMYAAAISYYADHPDEYASLYGRVVDELAAQRLSSPDSARILEETSPPSP